MSKTVFFISDTHFGHRNIVKFAREDGSPLRPWNDVDEMNEAMVENWNSVVRPGDLVYHGGDVVMNRRYLPILSRLNGRKKLIAGNHDMFRLAELAEYFENIYGVLPFKNFIMSHVPLHESSLYRFEINVHGHMHDKHLDDPRYVNISVENINYTPISLEELRQRF